MLLTDVVIRKAKAEDKTIKLSNERGLSLEIAPSDVVVPLKQLLETFPSYQGTPP